jgi:phenylpyruvate tautomerase PptA (4-oxalocrotonate tautomerase family)
VDRARIYAAPRRHGHSSLVAGVTDVARRFVKELAWIVAAAGSVDARKWACQGTSVIDSYQ